MSYKLVYKIGKVEAVARNNDPKVLREMISVIEKSKEDFSWSFYNDGGIKLDCSDDHEKE